MTIGYARGSKFKQNLDLRTETFKNTGIEKILFDNFSGVKSHEPQIEELLKFIRKVDILTVWRLDSIRGSTIRLI